ncbi:MAG: hypothetical protein LBP85_07190 [Prevotellaceae bacterium]|jgi:hypothetical protein|nr:hypothetical protein [Prevotellaceae bacterium]
MNLTQNTQEIEKMLDNEFASLQQNIINTHEQAGQVATGKTRSALEHSVSGLSGILLGAPWTFTLERGRGPAKSGNSQGAFLENLKQWIVAKGIPYNDNEDLERLAKFFKWYINKFGTNLWRKGGRQDIFTPAIKEFSNNVANGVANIYVDEVTNNLTFR